VLTEVKAVVARVTKPEGFAVLNADDPRVLGVREVISARPFLFTRRADHPEVAAHVAQGGWALTVEDGAIVWHHDGAAERLTTLDDVPITFGGRAEHMVENALAAAAACLAIGLDAQTVRDGLARFRNRAEQNRGRLNVYEMNGRTIVVDFAHNEAGLEHLLKFARTFCGSGGRLVTVIGTAGDREDSAITGIGRIAATGADGVIIKDTEKYLRGRTPGEMPALMRPVVGERLVDEAPNERSGFYRGLDLLESGDTLAVMCIEDYDEILGYLDSHANARSLRSRIDANDIGC
jgi:cyanophycin synthetase